MSILDHHENHTFSNSCAVCMGSAFEVDMDFVKLIANSTPKARALKLEKTMDCELALLSFILCAVVWALWTAPAIIGFIYF